MFDINQLKKISNKSLETITEKNEAQNKRGDDRFWKPERGKDGNASAVIRFLPSLYEGELPWVQTFSYFLKNEKGEYYVAKSLRTIGKPDPMGEHINKLWQSAQTEDEKQYLRDNFKVQNKYIANVLIIDDPQHPENNGQVKLFSFGKKILTKITDKAKKEFADDIPVNVFDWMEGANFKLRVSTVSNFPNYDRSEFANVTPIGDDEKIVDIASRMYDLREFTNPDNFPTYEELLAKRDKFLHIGTFGVTTAQAPSHAQVEHQAPTKASPMTSETSPWESDPEIDAMLNSALEDI